MGGLEQYRQIVTDFLESFVENYAKDAALVFDRERDRYLVMHNEWQDNHRMYGCSIQIDIIDSHIWIQQNNTEIYVDDELIAKGVAPEDIILGFRSPSVRKLIAAAKRSA